MKIRNPFQKFWARKQEEKHLLDLQLPEHHQLVVPRPAKGKKANLLRERHLLTVEQRRTRRNKNKRHKISRNNFRKRLPHGRNTKPYRG